MPEELSREKGINYRCVISKIGDQYYWATRDNVRMDRIEVTGFITFVAINGAGYVRILKPEAKETLALVDGTAKQFDYMEHLVMGLRTITYWGKEEPY